MVLWENSISQQDINMADGDNNVDLEASRPNTAIHDPPPPPPTVTIHQTSLGRIILYFIIALMFIVVYFVPQLHCGFYVAVAACLAPWYTGMSVEERKFVLSCLKTWIILLVLCTALQHYAR